MLICHLTESFAGGVARQITDIIMNGNFANHVLIYSPQRKDTDKRRIKILRDNTNITIYELPMGGIKSITLIPVALQLLQDIKPDILHAHSSFAGITARLVANKINLPVIYTPHGFAFLRNTDPFKWIYAIIESHLSKYTNRIIAVSNSEKIIAENNGISSDKIVVIENGIDLLSSNFNKNEIRKEWGIAIEEIVICTLGRPGKQKGYDLLENIIKNIPIQMLNNNLRFVIPMESDFINKSVNLNKSIKIDFIPSLLDPSILLALSDIYISTARWEGGPYGILEAMQHELAVIASDVPGNCDYVENGNTGLLLPLNINDFVEAIIKLSNDSELRNEFAQSGKLRVHNYFSLNAMLYKYEKLINTILDYV
jgi:glycosyltransferase involved in cell wall biosynthesis